MNIHDYYLSVPTAADMPEIPEGAALDVLGEWTERTGGTDDAPIITTLPGWHLNVRSTSPIEWPDSVTVAAPKKPWRVWG